MVRFCNRQRGYAPDVFVYKIIPETVKLDDYGMNALLNKTDGNQTLELSISYLAFSTFRITVDEYNGERKRYRLSSQDALRVEPKRYPVKTDKAALSLVMSGNRNDKAVVNFDPFFIDFFLDDVLVSQLNRRNMFNFETKEAHLEQKVSVEKVDGEHRSDTLPPSDIQLDQPSDDSSATVSESMSTTSDEDSGDKHEVDSSMQTPVDNSEQPSGDVEDDTNNSNAEAPHSENTASQEDPYPWTEYFKEHKDRRPFGPSSISLDIDFPGFVHAYGIPEHADSLVLKPTDKGDPYRLYNLDVFEYELNNPMALYGAVPLIWTLNPNHTMGMFWHNPSETWVDIHYSEHPSDGFLSKIPRLFSKPESFVKTRWISESGVVDAFVMLGHTPADIARAYAHLTGATPLPPLFALGYHQSRWNYNDQEDVLSVDQQFDTHRTPVDVIWLDIEHTDGKRYFTWDRSKFPNPGEMVDKLLLKGRKLVTVVDPHIKRDSAWQIYKYVIIFACENHAALVCTHQ